MIKRTIVDSIVKYVDRPEILALKWARQVWKTTIMLQIKWILDKKWEQTMYLEADNLDNDIVFSSPWNLIQYLESQLNFDKKIYLFVDEFQYINNAWLFLKNIYDKYKNKIKILVSWSSTLEITKNTEFLTWRIFEFLVYPVSFQEYLYYKLNIKKKFYRFDESKELVIFHDLYQKKLQSIFLEYITYWWYPTVLTEPNVEIKKTILKNIVSIYTKRHYQLIKSFKHKRLQ